MGRINRKTQFPKRVPEMKLHTGKVIGVGCENGAPYLVLIAEGRRIEIPYGEVTDVSADKAENMETAGRHLSKMIGAEIDYVITEKNKQRILASRKAAMKLRRENELNGLNEEGFLIKVGQIVDARVVVVMRDQAILEVAGVETTVPKQDFSWKRVSSLYYLIKPGEHIPAKVMDISGSAIKRSRSSIELSPRAAAESPFDTYGAMYPLGMRCSGIVTGSMPYRYFVTLQPEFVCMCKVHENVANPVNLGSNVELIVTVNDDVKKLLYGTIISVK